MIKVLEKLKDDDWYAAFSAAGKPKTVIGCSNVSVEGIDRESVGEIIAIQNGEYDGASWAGVFKLKDGRFISVCSFCDYTGWDCQAGGEIFVGSTLGSVIRYGLSEDERKRLQLDLEERIIE